jgi:hypothetical protein
VELPGFSVSGSTPTCCVGKRSGPPLRPGLEPSGEAEGEATIRDDTVDETLTVGRTA